MIELKNLSAGYGGQDVVHDISLPFTPGRILALLGPNGCGKSTLLRTALGLNPKSGGEVLMDGTPLDALSPRERALKAAYLSQSRPTPNIIARRMVLHGRFPYLSYPRRYHREDHEMVKRALDWVGAADLASRPLPELSGGQRQKVYLAMALAQDTAAILMDEPTTYLDVACQLEVMALARRLAKEQEELKDFGGEKPVDPMKIYRDAAAKDLSTHWGRKVSISMGAKKGKLEIEFYNDEDLTLLLDQLENQVPKEKGGTGV